MISLNLCHRCGAWIELGSHCAGRAFCVFLCIFVLRGASGPGPGFFDSQKHFNPPVVLLLTVLGRWSLCFSYSVWLCGLCCGTLRVLRSSRALCPRISSFLLVIASLGEGELVCVLLVRLIVCFVRVRFCHYSLPLGVEGLAAVCDCGTP